MQQCIQPTGTNRPRAWRSTSLVLALERSGAAVSQPQARPSTLEGGRSGPAERTVSGGHSGGETPVPIPNTAVKPARADGTWGEAPWESRSLPGFLMTNPLWSFGSRGFCRSGLGYLSPPHTARLQRPSCDTAGHAGPAGASVLHARWRRGTSRRSTEWRHRSSSSSTCASSSPCRRPRRQLDAALAARQLPHRDRQGYLLVFFAIWWAWVNFTWFASAYDVDDLAYRLLTFVQIVGVLILAAGVAARVRQRGLRRHDDRLRGDARRHGGAVAPGRPGDPAGAAGRAALRGRHQPSSRSAGYSVCSSPARPASSAFYVLARCEMLVPAGPSAPGRAARLAPRPHQRALRALHPHRVGRVHRGGHRRHPRRQHRARRVGRLSWPASSSARSSSSSPLGGGTSSIRQKRDSACRGASRSSGATGTTSSLDRWPPWARGYGWRRESHRLPPGRPRR